MNSHYRNTSRPMVGLKNVAKKLGLSVSVVSRALNPKPDKNARVSQVTRERVLKVARQMGFRRNRMAEFMKRGRCSTVGVFLPTISNRLIADLVRGISEVMAEEDFPLHFDFEQKKDGFHRFIERNRDLSHSGIISYSRLIKETDQESAIRNYRSRGGKVVLLNGSWPQNSIEFSSVSMDESYGGSLAAARLLSRGCQKFAVVGEFKTRHKAFLGTLMDNGKTGRFFPEGVRGENQVMQWIAQVKPTPLSPVGVFAVSDLLALRLMQLASRRSLCVGKELLMVGYDDLDLSAYFDPPLTTIHQPFRELGRRAAVKLAGLLHGAGESVEQIQPRLVVRESG